MNISYITRFDSIDIKNWSGTEYFIARSLEQAGGKLSYITNLRDKIDLYTRFKNKYSKFQHKKYLVNRSPFVAKGYAQQITQAIGKSTDIVFSPGTIPIAYLNTHHPKVFYTDATFASMVGYYNWFDDISSLSIREAMNMEKIAMETSSLAIFSSDWAAQSAIQDYNADPSKVKVVPFGANIQNEYSFSDVEQMIKSRSKDICKILFLAVEWERKGGNIVLQTVVELNKLGLKTELHIAGLKESPVSESYPWLVNHGFINKSTKDGFNQLDQLISDCHFLFVPSKAEAYGLVFCEASAYGVPSISIRSGGIPTIIKDNKNGMTFDQDTTINVYSEYIYNIFTNNNMYEDLAKSSYNEYKSRLNWNVAGKSLINYMKELL